MLNIAKAFCLSCCFILCASASVMAETLPRIGIIGAGSMGGTLGRLWVKAGYPVFFSSRHPQELQPLIASLGPLAKGGTPQQAAEFGEVVVMAVPYGALPALGKTLKEALKDKVVLDVANPYPQRDGDVATQALQVGSGVYSARLFPQARVVRGFNSIAASSLSSNAHRTGDALAVPLAGDDRKALDTVIQLTKAAGFAPVVVGDLSKASLFEPGGVLFLQTMTVEKLKQTMSQ
ncbi:putative oxidoreductase [Pantoea sp. AS-PWVM4]|uniref:NADPH-dependent F420 reductase n=1 Tax=Pantoea sp. AS-PWVM4 TaxID=1332069 RepID=UPI0003AC67BA|nr:NADPH-dependent F420 reductase [Pantoea sp. AS-PWVM4]ERK06191.1 putative oxidoreductase [Pantoea sp. AS-PWVM4]